MRRRRRHHRHRRNPFGISTRGITGRLVDGLKGGLAVLGGEAVSAAIPKLVPVAAIQTGFPSAAAEALTAVLTAPLVAKLIGSRWAQVYLYGGFARPLKGLVIGANIPFVSGALASYPGSLMALPSQRTSMASSLAANFDLATLEAEEAITV